MRRMALTPAERQRIYEEERVRIEAQERAKNDLAYARPFSWVRYIILAIIFGLVSFFPAMFFYSMTIAPALGIKDPGTLGVIVTAFIIGCLAARIFYRPIQRPM